MLIKEESRTIPLAKDVLKHPNLLEEIAAEGKEDLYFFCKGILGYSDMTESCHGPLCDFLQRDEWRRKMCIWPRAHLKTCIASHADPLRRAIQTPGWSALLIHENEDKAAVDILAIIKQIIAENLLFRACYHDRIPDTTLDKVRWSYSMADIARPDGTIQGPPTFEALGVKSRLTGKHRNMVVWDDMFAETAAASPPEAEAVEKAFAKTSSLLIRPAEDLVHVVGTRWHMNDQYAKIMNKIGGVVLTQEGDKIKAVTRADPRYLIWVRSINNSDGTPIWPERFPQKAQDAIKQEHGSYHFAMQYENNPIDPSNTSINSIHLRYWERSRDGFAIFDPIIGAYEAPHTLEDCDIIMVLDPAIGLKEHHSRTAITILAMNPDGKVLVIDTWAKHAKKTSNDPKNPGWLDQLYAFQRQYHPRMCLIEAVAYQKTIGQEDITERNTREIEPIYYEEVKMGYRGPDKDTRIRSVLQPYTEAHRLAIGKHQVLLMGELEAHPFGESKDLIDCLAHGIPRLFIPSSKEQRRKGELWEERMFERLGKDTGYGITW
jgi:hypothetical protein